MPPRPLPPLRTTLVVALAAALAAPLGGCYRTRVASGFAQPTSQSLLRTRGFAWSTDSTPRVRLHAESNGALAPNAARLRAVDAALDRVLTAFELSGDEPPVDVFVVASPERVRALFGRTVSGRAYAGTRVLALVDGPANRDWTATARHELTHVVLGRRWKEQPAQWIGEGVATWVGDHFFGQDVHRLTRDRLVATGRVLPLRTLASDFDGRPNEVTYLQAASVAKYLRERYGVAGVRAVWERGLDAIPEVTGGDVAAFERAWRDTVDGA